MSYNSKYGDNNLDYLADVGIVFRWMQKQYGLKRADLELLLYLHQFKFFTTQQFKDGEHLYSWDKNRFTRLRRDGYFKKIYEGNRRLGEHDKYNLSNDTVRMLRRMDRILRGDEEIPMTHRNKVWNAKKYSDKVLKTAIIKRHGNNSSKRWSDSDW